MKRALLLFLISANAIFMLNAQSSQFNIGLVFPSGDFSDYAATGFNAGYRYYSPLSVSNLSLVYGIDVFFNDLSSDQKDYLENNNSSYDITFRKYLNVPVTIGLNYVFPVNENVGIFGEAGLGLNCSFMTNQVFKHNSSSYKETIKYDPGFNLSYGLKGGLLIQEKFMISLGYNNFGSYKYKYKRTTSENKKSKGKTGRYSVSDIALGFGIRF